MSETKSKKSRIILLCQGGAGDVLAHTPMIRSFRKQYPEDEIIVCATYAQLLENNPNIDKVIPLKDPKDFYSEYVINHNVRFFKKHFVYDAILDDPANNCTCLPEFICNLYGTEYDKKPLDYFISDYEARAAKTFIEQYRSLKLPIVILHCTGAIPSDGNFNKTNSLKDLNIAKMIKLVKDLKDKIVFIHIGLEGEPKVEGAIDALGMSMRETIALLPLVNSYILIESLFAHCTNALQTHGIVIFQNTDDKFFGYTNNYNLSYSGGCAMHPCNRPVGALFDLAPGFRNPKTRQPLLWECPDQVCAQMPVEEIAKALLESIADKTKQKGNPELDAVRNAPPPNSSKFSTTNMHNMGKTIAGDVNLAAENDASLAVTNAGEVTNG